MKNCFIDYNQIGDETIIPIHVVRPEDWNGQKEQFTEAQQSFCEYRKFEAKAGQRLTLPDATGAISAVLFGAGPAHGDMLGAVRLGELSTSLGAGTYRLVSTPQDWSAALSAIGWGLGAYRFDRYLATAYEAPKLVLEEAARPHETQALIHSIHMGRDLVNMPAGDLGPVALAEAAKTLGADFDADVSEIIGDDLLAQNCPMIHAVGRAAHEAPRLVEFVWGDPSHPRLALIGKGITFDTGGVNIKSASSARLMKKDMGGAAHALTLARMIMANNLPVHLHVLISIAENAVSAGAYRPGDVLTSREGLTVEIDNTDAEGRLVLADALTKAAEDKPQLMIDFATLTGAARVALGPTLAPFYSNREGPVAAIMDHTKTQKDPFWPMPLWQPYMQMLNSPIADMKNAGGGFAGSITAALFLERFVKDVPWMHFDVYAWNPQSSPGRHKGGEIMTLRALYHWLKTGGLNGDFSSGK